MAVGKLPVRSCLIDGEAIVCDEKGLTVFELIRRHGALASAARSSLRSSIGRRRRSLPSSSSRSKAQSELLQGSHRSIVLNEHFEDDGAIVFREATALDNLAMQPFTALVGGAGTGKTTRQSEP
jgi:ATP-dependent DNA ligase